MNLCIKCGQEFKPASTTGRPPDYCSHACRKSAEYEITRINKRLGGLEDDLVAEKMHPNDKSVNCYGQKSQERIAALENAIVESESRLKKLLSAKDESI
ncbi:MAG: hypothetical protein WAW61_17625 [Methylococcaceae bacterium]